ncbi:MAG TPA: hypothetical protein PLC16_08435 [Defluviitaleaceae bacterium]|jgi:hypothetical protein|nr:hypothetical protein [Defluviitaleaceae bacterium]
MNNFKILELIKFPGCYANNEPYTVFEPGEILKSFLNIMPGSLRFSTNMKCLKIKEN